MSSLLHDDNRPQAWHCDADVTQNRAITAKVDIIDTSQRLISSNLSVCNVVRRIRLTGPAAINSSTLSYHAVKAVLSHRIQINWIERPFGCTGRCANYRLLGTEAVMLSGWNRLLNEGLA